MNVTLDIPSGKVDSVVLMRKTAITHLVDGGQRSVELPIVQRLKQRVVVQIPAERGVLPTGPYLLFVNRKTADGPVPSVAKDVTVKPALNTAYAEPVPMPPTGIDPTGGLLDAKPPVDLDGAGAVAVDPDLAFHEIGELSLTGHSHRSTAAAAVAHGHDHSDHDRGVPWQALPASAALAIASLLLTQVTRERRSAVAS